jgi:hypothetical protein
MNFGQFWYKKVPVNGRARSCAVVRGRARSCGSCLFCTDRDTVSICTATWLFAGLLMPSLWSVGGKWSNQILSIRLYLKIGRSYKKL